MARFFFFSPTFMDRKNTARGARFLLGLIIYLVPDFGSNGSGIIDFGIYFAQ